MKALLLSLIIIVSVAKLSGQDTAFAHSFIKVFSSERFDGRGYVNKGVNRAASYLDSVFHEMGLSAFGPSYLQKFVLPINAQPGKVTCIVDSKKLTPTKDFLVGSGSPASKGECEYMVVDTGALFNFMLYNPAKIKNKVIVLPQKAFRNPRILFADVAGFVFCTNSTLTWRISDATKVFNKPYFFIKDSVLNSSGNIQWEIESIFYPAYKTENVVGYIPGKKFPDSMFVFTGHYDHLGRMGTDTFFPRANDNASGIAMLVDLARYYSKKKNKPDYSIAFIALSGEECGLSGSKYFASNPTFDLSKIKFLVNLDMVGSGSKGIGVVNAKEEPIADSLLKQINSTNHFFPNIQSRGAACNSDHCAFVEKGVHGVFIYTKGPEHSFYHVPEDGHKLPLTKWTELHNLLTNFVKKYPDFEKQYD